MITDEWKKNVNFINRKNYEMKIQSLIYLKYIMRFKNTEMNQYGEKNKIKYV